MLVAADNRCYVRPHEGVYEEAQPCGRSPFPIVDHKTDVRPLISLMGRSEPHTRFTIDFANESAFDAPHSNFGIEGHRPTGGVAAKKNEERVLVAANTNARILSLDQENSARNEVTSVSTLLIDGEDGAAWSVLLLLFSLQGSL